MTFDVHANGRSRTVAVERLNGDRFRVLVDGQAREIDAVRTGAFGLSLLIDGDGGASREVQVAPAGPGEMLVRIDGRILAVIVNGRRRALRADVGRHGSTGQHSIAAPMPGRIVRVLVGVGDPVAARQPVVVVEAMKMENELRAPRDGRVKEITVEAGASVEAGRILLVIE